MKTTITKKEATELLKRRTSGRVFTVTFVKRTNGQVRVMNCRKGVSKDVTGRGLNFDPIKRNLVSVYDMQKRGHRFISLEAVTNINADKMQYSVV